MRASAPKCLLGVQHTPAAPQPGYRDKLNPNLQHMVDMLLVKQPLQKAAPSPAHHNSMQASRWRQPWRLPALCAFLSMCWPQAVRLCKLGYLMEPGGIGWNGGIHLQAHHLLHYPSPCSPPHPSLPPAPQPLCLAVIMQDMPRIAWLILKCGASLQVPASLTFALGPWPGSQPGLEFCAWFLTPVSPCALLTASGMPLAPSSPTPCFYLRAPGLLHVWSRHPYPAQRPVGGEGCRLLAIE